MHINTSPQISAAVSHHACSAHDINTPNTPSSQSSDTPTGESTLLPESQALVLPKISFDLSSLLHEHLGSYSLTYIQNGHPITVGTLKLSDVHEGASLAYEANDGLHTDMSQDRQYIEVTTLDERSSQRTQLAPAFEPDSYNSLDRSNMMPTTYHTPDTQSTAVVSTVHRYNHGEYMETGNNDHGWYNNVRSFPHLAPKTGDSVNRLIDPSLLNVTDTAAGKSKKASGPKLVTGSHMRRIAFKNIMIRNFQKWHMMITPEVIDSLEFLRAAVLSMNHKKVRILASRLLMSITPQRRLNYPYNSGTAPPNGWPLGVQYKDPAHLLSHERLAVIAWCYLNPTVSVQDLNNMHQTDEFLANLVHADLWSKILKFRKLVRNSIQSQL